MLWAGRLTGKLDQDPRDAPSTPSIGNSPETRESEAVLLPVADGVQVCRKR